VLARELRHAGGSQVEFYALEYAAALMPHAPTWPLAAAYLAWCPAHGQAALEALLRRLPLDAGDSGVAGKAAEVASLHGLVRLAAGAARCLQDGRGGCAAVPAASLSCCVLMDWQHISLY
jgi:nuclear pore complex protein Nup85